MLGGVFLVLCGFPLLTWSRLKGRTSLDLDSSTSVGARVAIVEARGTIGDNQNGVDSEKLTRLLRKYEKDDDVKAIVLRVDSPGGAVAPPQEIHDQLGGIKARKTAEGSMGHAT